MKEVGTSSFVPQLIAKNNAASKISKNTEPLINSIEFLKNSTVELKEETKSEGTENSRNSICSGAPGTVLTTLSPIIDEDLRNSTFSSSIIATVESSEQDLR